MSKLTRDEVFAVLALIDQRMTELGALDVTTVTEHEEYALLADAYNIIEEQDSEQE